MKYINKIITLGFAAITLASCGGGSQNQGGNSDSSATTEISPSGPSDYQPIQASTNKVDPSVFIDDSQFFLSEQKLPEKIDYNMNLDNLTYQQLYIYKAYPYALHGFWFRDTHLCLFFYGRTDWYYQKAEQQFDKYAQLWNDDYEKALKSVQLTSDEQKFVDRVSAKMAEFEKNNTINDNGLNFNNLALAINRYQVSGNEIMSKKLATLLSRYNIAFEPSKEEQLFQIYEDNDYKVMPSFITTDLFLQAYHMYFGYVLKTLENNEFTDNLDHFMNSMHAGAMRYENTSAAGADMQNAKDLADFVATFYAVGIKLLKNKNVTVPQNYKDLYNKELAAINKMEDDPSPLLQAEAPMYYTMFKPRGHYTRSDKSKAYFKCMMWLQTAFFPMNDDRAVNRAIAMASVYNGLDQATKEECLNVYNMITFLMGVPDNVAIIEMADFIAEKFPKADLSELVKGDKRAQIVGWVEEKFKTANRITPKVEIFCPDKLNFMPQRYEPDNEVLGKMADEKPNAERAYPKGLDVFDAFGIKAATALLDTFCTDSKSWSEYGQTRSKVKGLFNNFEGWNSTSYNKWIESLTALQKTDKNYPDFMKSPAYQLRNLNTALASWAELKHDAVLYAEQPMMAECGGDDMLPEPILVGFVEPNLIFWNKLKESVKHLSNILDANNMLTSDLRSKNEQLTEKIQFCIDVTQKELNGEPLSTEDFNTIRTMGSSMEYFTLSVLNPDAESPDSWGFVKGADKRVAVVCDVFTRNVDGCNKNGILYEATGNPNVIYALVQINGKTYITRGATFSYYEFVRPKDNRLTDEEWQKMIDDEKAPSQPAWFTPLMTDDETIINEGFLYSSGC